MKPSVYLGLNLSLWTEFVVLYQLFCCREEHWGAKDAALPYSRAVRGEAISTVPALSATSCLHGHLARYWADRYSSACHLPEQRVTCSGTVASAFSRGQLSDHAQGCTCRLTVCPDGRSNLESNLRPLFQTLQIPMNRLRQKLLRLLAFELAVQRACKYTPPFLPFVAGDF